MSEDLADRPPKKDRQISTKEWLDTEYKTRWKKAFDKLSSIKTSNPSIQEVRDFGRTVPSLIEEIKQPTGMIQTLIDISLDGVSEPDIQDTFDKAIIDITNQTSYLKELHDSGVAQALTCQAIDQGKFPGTLEWVDPDSALAAFASAEGTLGEYNVRHHRFRIFQDRPTAREMLTMLAKDAKLPNCISVLEHEIAHALQYANTPWIDRLQRIYRNDELLDELHAYVAEATAAPLKNIQLDEPEEIVDHILTEYEIDHVDKVSAVKACKRIIMLKLLGYDDKDLGQLIQEAEYDEKSRTYPVLDKAIKDELEQRGITDPKDGTIYLNALLAKHEIELHYQRHKAMGIAARYISALQHAPSWDQTKTLENN